jgi:hypothetical protein
VTSHISLTRCQLGYPVPAQCATPQLPGASCCRPPTPGHSLLTRCRHGPVASHVLVTWCQLSCPGPRLGYLVPAIISPGRDTRPQLAYPVLPLAGDMACPAYPVPYSAETVLRAIWPGLPCLPGELPRVCPLLSLPALPHGTRPHNSLTLCASLPCSHLTYLVHQATW